MYWNGLLRRPERLKLTVSLSTTVKGVIQLSATRTTGSGTASRATKKARVQSTCA